MPPKKFSKVKINPDLPKSIGKSVQDTFAAHLHELMNIELAEKVQKDLLNAYDELASIAEGRTPSIIKGKDPLSLIKLRPLFEKQISDELTEVKLEKGVLTLNVMNKKLLGYSGSPETGLPQSVDILGYYIEGVVGAYAFITKEHYAAYLRKTSDLSDPRVLSKSGELDLGRVGDGFMISFEKYEKLRFYKNTRVRFENVIHPVSGFPPYKGFEKVIKNIDINPYLEEAVRRTTKQFPGTGLKGGRVRR